MTWIHKIYNKSSKSHNYRLKSVTKTSKLTNYNKTLMILKKPEDLQKQSQKNLILKLSTLREPSSTMDLMMGQMNWQRSSGPVSEQEVLKRFSPRELVILTSFRNRRLTKASQKLLMQRQQDLKHNYQKPILQKLLQSQKQSS